MQRNLLASAFAIAMAGAVTLAAQDKVKAPIPQPGVPEIVTMEGKFVRAAYNNEGYVIIGYQVANRSIGDKFMMLDMGTTVRDGVPEFDLKRDAISVTTPDNKTIPMMTVEAYRAADMRAVENRARVQRDSINYFPPSATQAFEASTLGYLRNHCSLRRGSMGTSARAMKSATRFEGNLLRVSSAMLRTSGS